MTFTPQQSCPKLAEILSVPEIILKREDLHQYGSHKGRSIPGMIEEYTKQGYTHFVISSSGNAALAAIMAIEEYNKKNQDNKITLTVFVGENIDKKKLSMLKKQITDKNISIDQVGRPKQSAFQLDKEKNIKNLRQSTDEFALTGYKTLADELSEIQNLQAIFIPTSSGTTAQALGEFLPNVQIHVVQTSACHPIAQEFDKNFITEEKSDAGAIVDLIAHRKDKIVDIIKKSNGFGWVINNDEIKNAIKLVKKNTEIEISPNSALSVAGLQKAVQNGWKFDGTVACLVTGK